jgi:toxin ParE1/3/4
MSSYKIKIEERALLDIQQGFDYYEQKQAGLGLRFNKAVFKAFENLQINPFYQIRYSTFRCLPIKKFPFMVHYEVSEDIVTVFAVINTYLDPKKNWLR